jgi:hypothetical protein
VGLPASSRQQESKKKRIAAPNLDNPPLTPKGRSGHAPVGSLKTTRSFFAHVPGAKRCAPTRENDVSNSRPVIARDPPPEYACPNTG